MKMQTQRWSALLALSIPLIALADSVIFNDREYTCTNTCVITVDGAGNWRIVDSGGGTVTWRLRLPQRQ